MIIASIFAIIRKNSVLKSNLTDFSQKPTMDGKTEFTRQKYILFIVVMLKKTIKTVDFVFAI